MGLFDATGRAAFRILRRHLGWWKAISVGWAVSRREGRGEPFHDLPAAEDERETQSRAQIGPAILLFSELSERLGDGPALRITAEVVEIGAHVFLNSVIGRLDRATLDALDDEARDRFVREKLSRFPNATVRIEHVGAREVRFTVMSCRFVRLCRDAGVPELAPLFCAGDASFFGGVEPDVVLLRDETLAAGGRCCPFTLRFRDE
ncbi:MAG: L-2-amino-thiazoline-4-carboxylic acid hydrolase [Myxococcales bacterium]|nr:L-2-amino-thiazoline-4-carboxylic acid hydrolase [Myxococcales bacterium]